MSGCGEMKDLEYCAGEDSEDKTCPWVWRESVDERTHALPNVLFRRLTINLLRHPNER